MRTANIFQLFISFFILSCFSSWGIGNGYSPGVSFSGNYKSIISLMDFPQDNVYTDFLNRLRLCADVDFSENVSFFAEYAVEVHSGNIVGSFPFNVTRQMEPSQFWELENVIIDGDSLYARHYINRMFLDVSLSNMDIKAGRQAIGWGTGRAWHPTDPFYPANPLLYEREERQGADALNVEIFLNETTAVSAVLAGEGKRGEPVRAVKYRTGILEADVALSVVDDSEFSLGLDISRTFWNTEFHTSLRYAESGDTEIIAGLDRAFARKLKMGLEYYRNNEGTDNRDLYEWEALFEGKKQFLARDYIFGWLDCEITPLFRLGTYAVKNLNDGGLYLNPLVKYSSSSNTEFELGYILFNCSETDEFSFSPDVLYLKFQWFF
ncbi:MAG TPA: hypothetical protein PKN36_07810 [bacterium]|nr:hypothetical protein [bacterium]